MSAVTSKFRSLWQFLPKPVRLSVAPLGTAHAKRAAASHEPALVHALTQLTRPGDYCADVGANDGRLTLAMARCCGPKGLVVAFEAEPAKVLSIRQRVAHCGFADRVLVEALAVADADTPCLTLQAAHQRDDAPWDSTPYVALKLRPGQAHAPAIALDRYFAKAPRLDVLSIDAEGAESLVLAGASQIIERFQPAMLIEVHSLANWRACAALAHQGYRVLDLDCQPLDPQEEAYPPHIVLMPPSRSA